MKSFGRKTIKTHPDANFNDMENNSLQRREKSKALKSAKQWPMEAKLQHREIDLNLSENKIKSQTIIHAYTYPHTHTENDINISL